MFLLKHSNGPKGNWYIVKDFAGIQSSSFNPYKALEKLAVEDAIKFDITINELEKIKKSIKKENAQLRKALSEFRSLLIKI